jgi:tRNA U34 5-methylaminomethyl-2-thiouridine-forming methyltransferase MnmC
MHGLVVGTMCGMVAFVDGAYNESMHVFIKEGLKQKSTLSKVRLLEMGFGTGLNTILSIQHKQKNQSLHYDSIEKEPLSILLATEYSKTLEPHFQETLLNLHHLSWNRPHTLTDNITLTKHHQDILKFTFTQHYDLIYYDAFSPRKQPELWHKPILSTLYHHLNPGGIFVTYCAQGALKRCLKDCGFTVDSIPGPPNKREMIRATK